MSDRAARLRAEFDATFTRPPPPAPPPAVELLLVRAAGSRVALRLEELRWVDAAPRIARVPGARPDCRGVAAVQGRLVAVFDLSALLSREPGAVEHVAVTRADADVAVGFSSIEGRSALPLEALPSTSDDLVTTVPVEGRPHDLVSLPRLLRILSHGVTS